MKLYTLHSTDPTLNLAMEELLTREATEEIFLLWQNAPSIIVGCHQNTAAEIDEEFVQAHDIRVVRRMTGGGAVYHDLGNINFSCISLEQDWGQDSGKRFSAPIVNALRECGIEAEYAGRNDILANGLKVSGCARSVLKAHTLFHGTLLFDVQLDVLARALRPDPDKILSKGIKSVRARVGNLREMLRALNIEMEMPEFVQRLMASASHSFGDIPFEEIPAGLREKAEALADAKYRMWEWNYGTNLPYDVQQRLRFAGGGIQARMNIRENRIADLSFTGDFFGSHPVEELIQKIIGLPPRKEVLLETLRALPLTEYIAGITAEELATLLAISE